MRCSISVVVLTALGLSVHSTPLASEAPASNITAANDTLEAKTSLEYNDSSVTSSTLTSSTLVETDNVTTVSMVWSSPPTQSQAKSTTVPSFTRSSFNTDIERNANRPVLKVRKHGSYAHQRNKPSRRIKKKKHFTKKKDIKKKKLDLESELNKNRPIIKDCPGCSKKDITLSELEKHRKESFKKQILQKLRLDNAPEFEGDIPNLPLHIFHKIFQQDEAELDDDDFYAKTKEMIVFGNDVTKDCYHRKSTGCYYFDLKHKVRGTVASAELLLYKLPDANDGQQEFMVSELGKSRLRIPKYPGGKARHRKLRPRNIVTRIDSDVKQGWMTFQVYKMVQRWVEKPYRNEGVAVKCKTCAGQSHKVLYGAKDGYKPVLVIYLESGGRRRSRRSLDCESGTSLCCRQNYFISFRDINMIRIIQPEGIWANYCTGTCNEPQQGYYNHTLLIQADRGWRSDAAVRQTLLPCCGPVRLKTVSVLYLDEENDIRRSHVPNIAVEECGCL